MEIASEKFEMAVRMGYEFGVKAQLAEMLTPQESETRINEAILKAYNVVCDVS